jgi:hypothetical protein
MKNFLLLFFIFSHQIAFTQSTTVVISQIYGGGGASTGNTPAYLYDYVELHNISSVSQNVSSWSIQYGSATGNFTGVCFFPDNTTISAGRYALLQVGNAGKIGSALPVTPDFITTSFTLALGSGKVALTNQYQTSRLGCGSTTSPCSFPIENVIDLVAYGASNNAEGGVAVNKGILMTNTEGAVRKSNGCLDTDNNNNDFDVVNIPVPRNSLSSAIILPLIVTRLKASVINQEVILSWSTVNEFNMEKYMIEKSIDGSSYTCLGSIVAKNKSDGGNDYSYTDALINGISYYRLKMVDKDNSAQYSAILPVSGNVTFQLKVYPNPAHSSIIISYPKATIDFAIEIISFNGNKILSIPVEKGAVQTSIDVSNLIKGNYIVVYNNGFINQTVQLMKE